MNKKLLYWIGGIILLGGFIYLLSRSGGSGGTVDLTTGRHFKGGESASVTLVEFSDIQCPACAAYQPIVNQLHAIYGDRLKIVYRHFPLLQIHPNAMPAAIAAEAAGEQGKFWDMLDLMYQRQKEWERANNEEEFFVRYAQELGLNADQFQTDMKRDDLKDRVLKDLSDGRKLNIGGTPTFFLNGEEIQNPPRSSDEFRALIDPKFGEGDATNASAGTIEPAKEHMDIRVVLLGKPLDLSLAKYQSSGQKARDRYVQLRGNNGEFIHAHRKNVTVGEFFKTLGITMDKTCFKLDTGTSYCNDGKNSLKLFVNGNANADMNAYVLKDLDRVLVSYGPENDTGVAGQLATVGDKACIYSGTCPARGTAPDED